MALSSVIQIVNRACDELGLPRPGSTGLVGSSSPDDRQMLALLNAAGLDLVAHHDWSTLIATASIVTATASSSYALPTDFDRIVDNTGWDRTNYFPMVGSISPQKHQFWLSSSVVAPTTRKEFRLYIDNTASTVYVHPAPTSVETLSFLYIKKNWVTNSLGASADSAIATDDDLPLFLPKLMVKELKWRFRAAKGLDANALKMESDSLRDLLVARDIGSGAVDMTGDIVTDPGMFLTPDGSWNLT